MSTKPGTLQQEIAALAGLSRPTVNFWLSRYGAEGIAGLLERRRGAGREQVRASIQALDRTQPLLPIEVDASVKRTHDYVRYGTTNLFAALNVGTGEVFGECTPPVTALTSSPTSKKAVKLHAGTEIHVVLDNLSAHTTPDVRALLEKNPHVHFHFTPQGSSWMNQIETWFGIATHQSIYRSTFTSVKVLIKQIRDYITHWNNPWTATADETLAKARLAQINIKKLVNNNAK